MNISSRKEINPLNMMTKLSLLTSLYNVFCICLLLSKNEWMNECIYDCPFVIVAEK
jgi:hypothetical protein